MKINYLPQIMVTTFMMFLIGSCAITDPNIDAAREALYESDYEEVIQHADKAIEENPENGNGYYYKGVAYISMAIDKPVEEREEDYKKARNFLKEAKKRYEVQAISSDESENLSDLIIEFWGQEHNEGINPLTDDIVSSPEDSLILASHHFRNAIAINPDSVQSYNLLAEVYFALDKLEEAEEINRHIIYKMGKADLFNYYRLSYMLMETGRNEEAIEILLEARERYPDRIEIVQEITNAYLNMGDTEKALKELQELIELDPENPQYRLVYATQIYQIVQELDTQIRDLHDEIYDLNREIRQKARENNIDEDAINEMLAEVESKRKEADALIEESFELSDEAEEQLLLGLENNPDDPDFHSTLGIIYQNRAAVLQDQRNMTDDFDEADKYDQQAKEYLRRALPHYEKAAELEEDNPEHWQALFRVYTNLGMQEEAEKAQEKADL